jgi:hypothetical protein
MKAKALLALTGGLITWGSALSQELQDYSAVAANRPLTYRAGQEIIFDSNAIRLAGGQAPPAVYGVRDRSDTISRTFAGFTYNDAVASQNLRVDLNVDARVYSNFSALSRNTYSLIGSLSGNIDRAWYYGVGLNVSSSAGDFANQFGFEPNATRSIGFDARVGYRFSPTWSIYLSQSATDRTNSAVSLSGADTSQDATEIGLRFEPGSAINAEIGVSNRAVKFPNRQRFDSLGNPLTLPVSNSFQADQLVARVSYAPTAQSSSTGNVGFGNTRFDELTQRNSNNVLFGLDYRYAFSNVTEFGIQYARDLGGGALAFTSPVLSNRFGVRATWKPTGKISLTGDVSTTNRRFTSDPSTLTTTNSLRADTLRTVSLIGQYEMSRAVRFNAGFSTQTRSANLSNFSFSGRLLTVGITINLD